jgi:hypothetical protein
MERLGENYDHPASTDYFACVAVLQHLHDERDEFHVSPPPMWPMTVHAAFDVPVLAHLRCQFGGRHCYPVTICVLEPSNRTAVVDACIWQLASKTSMLRRHCAVLLKEIMDSDEDLPNMGAILRHTVCALEPSGDEYALMQAAALELFAMVVTYKPTKFSLQRVPASADDVHGFLINAASHFPRLVSSPTEVLRRGTIELITAAAAVDVDAVATPALISTLVSMAESSMFADLVEDGIQLLSLLSLTSDGARIMVLKSALPLLDHLLRQKDGAVHSKAMRLVESLGGSSHESLSFANAETIAPMLPYLNGDPHAKLTPVLLKLLGDDSQWSQDLNERLEQGSACDKQPQVIDANLFGVACQFVWLLNHPRIECIRTACTFVIALATGEMAAPVDTLFAAGLASVLARLLNMRFDAERRLIGLQCFACLCTVANETQRRALIANNALQAVCRTLNPNFDDALVSLSLTALEACLRSHGILLDVLQVVSDTSVFEVLDQLQVHSNATIRAQAVRISARLAKVT